MSGRHLRAARRVLRLLDDERKALLQADFGHIERLATKLQAACDTLESLPPIDDSRLTAELDRIRREAARNQSLAEASRRGVAAATRLRRDFETARNMLSTYTGSGLRRDLRTPSGTRDRRA